MAMPESLQQLIERQLERLAEDERRLLSVASVAGLEFSTRTLSGGMDSTIQEIETICANLLRRRQFLRPAKMIQLRDGSLLERYGFIHAMHQHVLYHGVPQPRRIVLHRRIGEFQETAYADHLQEIAAELAVHFQEGRDYRRAIRYRRLSAAKALAHYANREAQEHLGKAVALLELLALNERAEIEAGLLQERGAARRAMDDNEGAAADFEHAAECARQAGRREWEVEALLKLSAVTFWIDSARSLEVAERAVELSHHVPDALLQQHARGYCASRRIRLQGWDADDFAACRVATAAAREANHAEFLGLGVMHLSFFEAFRSHERDACLAADEGMRIALEAGDSFLYISCQYFKSWALLHLGQLGEALNLGERQHFTFGEERPWHGDYAAARNSSAAARASPGFRRGPAYLPAGADPRARRNAALFHHDHAGRSTSRFGRTRSGAGVFRRSGGTVRNRAFAPGLDISYAALPGSERAVAATRGS